MQEKGIIKLVGKRPKYIVLNPLLFYRGSAGKRIAEYNEYEKLTARPTAEVEEKGLHNGTEYLH
ncbi:MAG: hypothetical protein N3I35_04830 [Clostridia bacterium]|nr:hypothetical protein [Clostridia bacterium]